MQVLEISRYGFLNIAIVVDKVSKKSIVAGSILALNILTDIKTRTIFEKYG